MNLPPPLRSWAPYLWLFHERVALALGTMLAPLARTVGSLPLLFPTDRGEPEGFDGISNRGDFGHLLASEWLFADVFPHEFLRRAADREQLFLRREFRQPKGKRLSIILFDCGPDQLGNPRLVQLALLLVFAHRAAAGNATFAWGTLQDPECRLIETVDLDGVKRFLQARTLHFVIDQDTKRWSRRLADLELDLTDCWVAGLPADGPCDPKIARIFIGDVEEPGVAEVEVRVQDQQGQRTLNLKLPAPPVRSRLLRDPFKPEPDIGEKAATGDDEHLRQPRLVVDDLGDKVFVQLTKSRFCFLKIPSSCRPGSRVRRANGKLAPGFDLLGVALNGKNFWLLARRGRWLHLIPGHVKKSARSYPEKAVVIKDYERFLFSSQGKLLTCCYLPQPGALGTFFVRHTNGHLFRLKKRGEVYTLVRSGQNVIHLERIRNKVFVAALRGSGQDVVVQMWGSRLLNLRRIPMEQKGTARILFSKDPSSPRVPLNFGLQIGLSRWYLEASGAKSKLELSPQFQVSLICRQLPLYLGFGRDKGFLDSEKQQGIKPLLFMGLDSTKKKVLGFNGEVRTLFESETPISQIALCSNEGAYVLLTEDGRLEIRDRDHFQQVSAFSPGELL